MNFWKVILATVVIFTAGLMTGALVVRKTQRAAPAVAPTPPFQGPELVQQRFLERMTRELRLTPAQTNRLATVFHDSRERMKTLWDIIGPEFQIELQQVGEKIRSELTPEQREKFEVLLKNRRRGQASGPPGDLRSREHRPSGSRPGSRRTDAPDGPSNPPPRNPPSTAPR